MAQNRYRDVDILKSIGIFLMVFNHVGFGDNWHQYIQSFHMPLFFIASGYLWRWKDEAFLEKEKRKAKGLLVPYVVFGLLLTVIWTLLRLDRGKEFLVDGWLAYLLYPTRAIRFGGPLWFLPAMFFADMIYSLLRLKVRDDRIRLALIILIALAGCIFSRPPEGPDLVYSIEPALVAVLFMYCGELIKKHDRILHLPLPVTALLFVAAWKLSFVNPTIDMRTSRYCIVPLFFLNGLVETLAWWNLSVRIANLPMSRRMDRLVTYLSRNSILYLLLNRAYITFYEFLVRRHLNLTAEDMIPVSYRILILTLVILTCALTAEILPKTPLSWTIGKKRQPLKKTAEA